MTNRMLEGFLATLLFTLAGVLSAIMSALALGFVWARGKSPETESEGLRNRAFLADKQRALSFYRVFSAAYDFLNPHFYTERMRSEITGLLEGEGLRVLDVGCGTGYTSRGVLQRKGVSELVGLDMNPVQLGRARRNLLGDKARVSLAEGDAENLPFRDCTFHAVVSVGAMEYFPDPERAVEEMTRVAKPGGIVIVGGPELTWFRKTALDRLFYTPSKEEARTLLGKAGLKGDKILLTGLNTVFETSSYVVVAFGHK
jgi:ubiquinone/menaquinone biosynthesis C-methylase UbiE